ncbi:MAG: hypothetical protein ACYCUT_01075 [bacterium]
MAVLAGCAPGSVLKSNNGNKDSFQKKIENKVLTASLRLNGIPDRKIKTVIISTSNGARSGSYIDPSFMEGESNIVNRPAKRRPRIVLNKTEESRNGKIILKILSIKSEKIFEIISFSLTNLYPSPVKYRQSLFEKSDGKAKYARIPFKSNIKAGTGGKNYFILPGRSKIKEKIIFLRAFSKTAFDISALYKNSLGGIKFIRLFVKL